MENFFKVSIIAPWVAKLLPHPKETFWGLFCDLKHLI